MFWIITQYFMENCSSSSRLCYYLGYFHHPKDSEDLDLAFETANSRQWFWFSPTKTLTNNLRLSWAGAQSSNRKPGWQQVPSNYPSKCPHKCSLLIALCTRTWFLTAALCIHQIPHDVLRGQNLSSLHQNNMGPKSKNNQFILVTKWQASITQTHALNVCKLSLVLSDVACPSEQFQQWSLQQGFKDSAHTWWNFSSCLNVFCLTASLMINTLGKFTMSPLGVNNFDLNFATYKITTYETAKNIQTFARHSFINTSTIRVLHNSTLCRACGIYNSVWFKNSNIINNIIIILITMCLRLSEP